MHERLLITFAILGSFGAIYLLVKRRQITSANRASRQSTKPSGIPTIIYFWAPGCPVCKLTQRKILDEIVAEYGRDQLALTAHNTDEKPDIAREWGIRTLPTTYILDGAGAIQNINNGLAVAETLRKQLKPLMRKNRRRTRRMRVHSGQNENGTDTCRSLQGIAVIP